MVEATVDVSLGGIQWISRVMHACSALLSVTDNILIDDRGRYCNQVANCFYNSVDENAKANLAARQTIVALWPAIVSFISVLYPDAAEVAYDHLGWAAIFAMTSCGIAGSSMRNTTRHFNAPDYETAKEWCDGTVDPPVVQRLSRRTKGVARKLHIVNHGLLLFSIAIYGVFLGLFIWTLKETILTWQCSPYWFGSLWYILNCLPALMQASYHLLFTSDVFLFVPTQASGSVFKELKTTNNLKIWMHVFKRQTTNEPFRLLIREPPESLGKGLIDILVATTRLGIFVFGSVTQSSLIVMPMPWDSLLFGLVVAAAFLPRVMWVKICAASVHPKTRVVFY